MVNFVPKVKDCIGVLQTFGIWFLNVTLKLMVIVLMDKYGVQFEDNKQK